MIMDDPPIIEFGFNLPEFTVRRVDVPVGNGKKRSIWLPLGWDRSFDADPIWDGNQLVLIAPQVVPTSARGYVEGRTSYSSLLQLSLKDGLIYGQSPPVTVYETNAHWIATESAILSLLAYLPCWVAALCMTDTLIYRNEMHKEEFLGRCTPYLLQFRSDVFCAVRELNPQTADINEQYADAWLYNVDVDWINNSKFSDPV
jgi:hypothetical protein